MLVLEFRQCLYSPIDKNTYQYFLIMYIEFIIVHLFCNIIIFITCNTSSNNHTF